MVKKISDINCWITEGKGLQLAEVAEALHEAQYSEILPLLTQKENNIQLVCVAGPSSSGKTIFTNKLRERLELLEIPSLVLSMDNYFLDKKDLKPDASGSYDFEAVDVVDVNLFRSQLGALTEGKPVFLPVYNFYSGKKEYANRPTFLPKDGIVFVEGIHALNYVDVFGTEWKTGRFGIYIAPEDGYKTPEGNLLEPQQVRMIRRMVRDACYRNCSIMGTLDMWDSVRQGEIKWILPYAQNADYHFNSSLAYEIPVLKPFFMAHYNGLTGEEKARMETYLDKKILEAFLELPVQVVPQASILHEFIPRIS